MMSSPVYRGFSRPVTCVPTASNPTTTKDVTVVKSNSSVAPVSKKIVPIFTTLTNAVSKPHYVAMTVDETFSETPVTRPIAPKPGMEKRHRSINKVFISIDADVWDVSNSKWGSKTFYVIVVGTWTVLPAISTSMLKPIVVSFKKPSPLKKSKSRKRNVNANVNARRSSC